MFHSFDFSSTNVHDVNNLRNIKENLKNCLLIGGIGYISKALQVDLFNYARINLSVPMWKTDITLLNFPKQN
ncbi:hypothetical protein [Riemerella anatipestifer]|uniref:hypothetical protein n=1 Tax=Riemerella anatipestifer TaxID=34085 RepID=UPI001EC5CFD8|nr:hypothetical protein [Riemerella anatipestifer]